jgi:anti-anti-sigma factor
MATASERDPGSTSQSCGFTVQAELDGPRMTLVLTGELDLAGTPALEGGLEALPWPQLAELVLDLAELTFIDSTGLSALIRAAQRAAAAGVRFSVVRGGDQPRKLFALAGVTDSLNVRPEAD